MTRSVIMIGGIDGGGKTTFAGALHAAFLAHGISTLLLHVDDFRRPVAWTGAGRDEATVYLEDYYDFAAIELCLRAFRAGAAQVERPLFDELTESAAGHSSIELAGIAVVILEGVFTMRVASAQASFMIHLATSFGEARRRIHARRTPRWRTPEEFDYRISTRYFPAQRRYLAEANPERAADVLIDNDELARPRLLRADLSRLSPLLWRPLTSALFEPGPTREHRAIAGGASLQESS